jgi:hypothetical protein
MRKKYYPYMFSFGTYERVYHDTLFGLKSRGFFTAAKGFKKLGVPYENCYAKIGVDSAVFHWIHQVVPDSTKIVPFNFGCPQIFATPIQIQNAVRKFKTAGVTNVFAFEFLADFANFTNTAQQQNFHPKYGLADDELVTVTQAGAATKPNAANVNGALAIAAARDGEENTPSLYRHPTPGTKRCNSIMAKHSNLSSTYKELYAIGNACDNVWMFEAAVDHAPSLATNALAAGLQASRSVDFSFPQGPNYFGTPGETSAGQYWRVAQFTSDCACWHVIDPNFHRSTY